MLYPFFIWQSKVRLYYKNVISKSVFFYFLFFTLSHFFIFCGCGSPPNVSTGIIQYTQDNALTSLDPAFARSQANNWLCRQLYNGLIDLDDSLRLTPALATRYEVSADGLVYTFHLRQPVYFHKNACFGLPDSTRRVIAADVVYSFGRIISTALHSPGSWVFVGRVDSLQPFSAPNDSTFVLRLRAPFRPMLQILTMPYCSIVAHEAVDFYGNNYRSNPVGTGAFGLVAWRENQVLLLAKNKAYWEANLPRAEGIRVSFVTDKNTQFLDFRLGNLDFISNPNAIVLRQLIAKNGTLLDKWREKYQYQRGDFLNTEYLGINLAKAEKDRSPLQIKALRQALNYGFDRAKLLRTVKNGIGTPAYAGFAPKGLPSFDTSVVGYTYNPAKARQLLAAAGYPDGRGLPPLTLSCDADYLDYCTFIVRQWADIGVRCQVETVEKAMLRELMAKGEVAFFRASWIADYPDAENFYTVFYSKNEAPPNYTRFRNAQFDKLYEQAIGENNEARRYALYRALDNILIEEAPVIFVFYDQTARFAQKNVRGLVPNAMNIVALKQVRK